MVRYHNKLLMLSLQLSTQMECFEVARHHTKLLMLNLLLSSSVLSSLELSDANVYAPYVRAILETASHFWEEVVLKREPSSQTECFAVARYHN